MKPYLVDQDAAVATIMLSTQLADCLTSNGQVRDNPYYKRLARALHLQWPDMHARTLEKVQSVEMRLASFQVGDAVPWMSTVPKDAGMISYPPFFVGGYEAMFHKLDLMFDWDKPSYGEIDENRRNEFLASLTDRQYWAFGVMHKLPEYEPYLRGLTYTTAHGVTLYIYASRGVTRVVMPRQETEPVTQERLTPGDEIGDNMTLAPLNYKQFNALRSKYMNANIKPAGVSASFAVLVDGKLVGAFAFSTGSNAFRGKREVYMMSDFAVAPTDYQRLSKLVLYAVLSRESQMLAQRLKNRKTTHVFTTAFTNRPVSMKYRGLFDVYNRKERGDDEPYRYHVNYIAPIGQWTLNEGLAEWKRKHSKKN